MSLYICVFVYLKFVALLVSVYKVRSLIPILTEESQKLEISRIMLGTCQMAIILKSR